MKTLILFVTLVCAGVAHANCGPLLGTFTKNQLTVARMDQLVGQVVTIIDSRGKRTLRGLVIAAQHTGGRESEVRSIRLLDYANGEVRLLEYGRHALALKSITTHGQAPEIRELERRPEGTDVIGPALFATHDSNFRCLDRDLILTKPVSLVVAREGRHELDVLDGRVTLPPRSDRDSNYLTIETADGPVRVHQLRIVAAYGAITMF